MGTDGPMLGNLKPKKASSGVKPDGFVKKRDL